MKRMLFVLLAVGAAVMAFGACSAFAESLDYDSATGELSYVSYDFGGGGGAFDDNHVHIKPVSIGGVSGVAVNDGAWWFDDIQESSSPWSGTRRSTAASTAAVGTVRTKTSGGVPPRRSPS
jgi:hypothetical protein